jgi:hypothetical protein
VPPRPLGRRSRALRSAITKRWLCDLIDRQQQLWKFWVFCVGLVFVILPVLALLLFWAYPLAWMTTADLTLEERAYYINKGLDKCCVSARLPSRGMIKVSRDDIAEIGASRCAQDYRCASRGDRSKVCFDVDVTFYCAYDIKDRAGNAGTAILRIDRNKDYTPYAKEYETYRRDKYDTNGYIENPDKKLDGICSEHGCGRP